MVFHKEIIIQSKAFDSIYDLTEEVEKVISESKINNGIVNIFHAGSTASITAMEFEFGLEKDMKSVLNKLFPRGDDYFHNRKWDDGNGDAHLEASFIGPSITCPLKSSKIILGAWQQVILIDSDNKARTRKVIVTVFGE